MRTNSPRAIQAAPSGEYVDIFAPDLNTLHIMDIAHALSMKCRFNGFTRHLYSVGQHCINVANVLRVQGHTPRVQLQGLMHDASEAYMQDIASPQKVEFPEFRRVEEFVLLPALAKRFGFLHPFNPAVHTADGILLHVEARGLMPTPEWATEYPTAERDFEGEIDLREHHPSVVRSAYLGAYIALRTAIAEQVAA